MKTVHNQSLSERAVRYFVMETGRTHAEGRDAVETWSVYSPLVGNNIEGITVESSNVESSNKDKGSPLRSPERDSETIVEIEPARSVQVRTRARRPSPYRVLILNDDFTPMDFVVEILERVFWKTREEAIQVMLEVHHNGLGECGTYTYEAAESKVAEVMGLARKEEHPLQCVLERR